ncbi:hypothetical protein Efla_003198 [Eimeria flavescens]
MATGSNNSVADLSSEATSDTSDAENKEAEDQVPLEKFAADEQFSQTLQLLQLPPAERSREHVECIFELVRDNKFFAELDAEVSLELCRHMTYTTMKADRVLFYKGDPGKRFALLPANTDNWYLILAGSAGVYIEELKDSSAGTDANEHGGVSKKRRRVDKTSCVANLGEGHSFGELGLIRNDVRSAALLTHSDCLFLTLDKKSFQHCLGNFLKQKSDDKVQTLRQVLPGAKELRKLVVEQLTYFFKETTLQKNVALSTEGNKEETLYLIVKGFCEFYGVFAHRRYVGDFHSICAGEGEAELAVAPISRVVTRARQQQKEQKVAADSSKYAVSGRNSDSSSLTETAVKGVCCETLQLVDDLSRKVRSKKPSVFLEDLDLALLQEGCVVNFCSLFFDSPEPFSVFAFSSKTRVFSITRAELFNHMPPSVLDAVRITGLLLLQHLERRIGQQEQRIRSLELVHQRDATQGTGELGSTDKNLHSGLVAPGSRSHLLPLTFSPFLSKTMGEYIGSSSLALEGHFDRFTRNLLCFQPHMAVLNHRTFRLLQQQKQLRQQRHKASPLAINEVAGDLLKPHENSAEQVVLHPELSEGEPASLRAADVLLPAGQSAASNELIKAPQIEHQIQSGSLNAPAGDALLEELAQPDRHKNSLWKASTKVRAGAVIAQSPRVSSLAFLAINTGRNSSPAASFTTPTGDRRRTAGVMGSLEAEAGGINESTAAREAAACASSALALGYPIVSDSALEFFFRNISRDAVNINNKFCCHFQSEAQVSLINCCTQARTHVVRLAARQTGEPQTTGVPTQKNGINSQSKADCEDALKRDGYCKASESPVIQPAELNRIRPSSPRSREKLQTPRLPQLAAQSLQSTRSRIRKGSSTAREYPEKHTLQFQCQHQDRPLNAAEIPNLHTLLLGQDATKAKDRAVSLRGMAAAMQLFSASVQRRSGKSYLQADACEAPSGASACTGRRMLAQQIAQLLHAQRNDGS